MNGHPIKDPNPPELHRISIPDINFLDAHQHKQNKAILYNKSKPVISQNLDLIQENQNNKKFTLHNLSFNPTNKSHQLNNHAPPKNSLLPRRRLKQHHLLHPMLPSIRNPRTRIRIHILRRTLPTRRGTRDSPRFR